MVGESFLEKNAIRSPFWLKTPLILIPLASVLRTNCWVKFGRASTGATVIAYFSAENAISAAEFHVNASFFNSSMTGAAKVA